MIDSKTNFKHLAEQGNDTQEVARRGVQSIAPSGPSNHGAGIAEPRPPVLIMNLFFTGLGIARDLSKCGVRVIGLSAHRDLSLIHI